MSTPRLGRLHKATAIVPLAVLSTAWTASLAGVGATTALANGTTTQDANLPDGTSVPTHAIEAPASVSLPDTVAPAVPKGRAGRAVRQASASGVSSVALAAYQRAETVINSADKSCRIDWQLIAAIGRVESDHGRYGGNVLNTKGVATPGIYGIPLDGKNGTQAISDTDAGQYDGDAKWDRAVGPMQFIPSTWSVVGVDGDNDGKRNPQDIHDAALASAVYLCSGEDNLATDSGRRSAVYRYNHSDSYVDLVLSIREAYLDGEFSAVPSTTTSAGTFSPDPSYPTATPAGKPGGNGPSHQPSSTPSEQPSQGSDSSGGNDTTEPQPKDNPPKPEPEPEEPTPTEDPAQQLQDTVETTKKTVEDTLSKTEASTKCLTKVGVSSVSDLDLLGLLKQENYEACMADLGF